MPFMQRIDRYGIALHGGQLPGYPASHGCIRLPAKFAAKLFAVTEVGTPVMVGDTLEGG
jgi:lipoprotein-anchoring transpeptidase ErfK/SrfK